MSSSRTIGLEHVADPVRRVMLERLDDGDPTTVADLAAAAGVHENTARAHLATLEAAGVVARAPLATGTRGRPRAVFRLADGWRLPGRDFKGLADLFAQTLAALDPAPAEVQRLGHDWGRFLAGRPGVADAADLVEPALRALGFDVEVDEEMVRLSGCPCRLVLPDRPELVCRLAAAVVDGLAAAARRPLHVAHSAHDPVARRCELTLAAAA